MKKTNVVLLSVLFAAISLTASSAFAVDGVLTISGTVDSVATVLVYDSTNTDPITTYTSLNLAVGQTDTHIATVREMCNDFDGYTVNVTSTNGTTDDSYLLGADSGSKVAYTLKYGVAASEAAVVFAANTAQVTDASALQLSATPKNLLISIDDDSEGTTPNNGVWGKNSLTILPADTYSDTLTFTIAPKA